MIRPTLSKEAEGTMKEKFVTSKNSMNKIKGKPVDLSKPIDKLIRIPLWKQWFYSFSVFLFQCFICEVFLQLPADCEATAKTVSKIAQKVVF